MIGNLLDKSSPKSPPKADYTIDIGGVPLGLRSISDELLESVFGEQYPRIDAVPQITISEGETGLQCVWQTAENGCMRYFIDVNKFVKQQRSFPAAKQAGFNQALGKKSEYIIDATAGWGSDALLMCVQGYQVTMLERNPVMALLLNDAMARLRHTSWAVNNPVTVPHVIHVDALDYLKSVDNKLNLVDCIYLDPMFPPKRKTSAAVNKKMQLLQWLVGEDIDAKKLADTAVNSKCKRVVVKRPNYAKPLLAMPAQRFSTKLVHYDVYIKT